MIIFGIILGLLILVLLVVVHELGHAIAAKRNGVQVEEFGIGFPPKAWSKKLKKSFLGSNVLFSINWLPLGGFVRLKGEHDAAKGKGEYGAATFWQKTKILLAGVLINWLVAAGLLTILAWTGLPKILPNQVTIPGDTSLEKTPVEIASVVENSPAAKAGLHEGDKVLRFDGEPVRSAEDLTAKSKQYRGKTVEVIYSRQNVEKQLQVTLSDTNEKNKGYLGVGAAQREVIRATWSAPIVGIATTGQFTWVTLQGVGQVAKDFFGGLVMQLSPDAATRQQGSDNVGRAGANVSSPIGIVGIIFPAAERAGLTQVVLLTAIISLTLAVMNVLPIPALDGGRWFVTALFKVLKKPLTREREENIQVVGFLVLMGLFLLVVIADIGKFFA